MSEITSQQPWYVRPRMVLPVLSTIILAVVLLTPEPSSGNDDSRLSTYSAQAAGGRLLYELSERLGWNVERSTSRNLPLDSSSIVAVLAPPIALREREIHELLEHARGGGALLVAAERGARVFLDSLGLEAAFGSDSLLGNASNRTCTRNNDPIVAFVNEEGRSVSYFESVQFKHAPGFVVDTLLTAVGNGRTNGGESQPVVLAARVGKGRIVLSASASVFRNAVLRRCAQGMDIIAVRALSFLSDGQQNKRLIFDEFHQGYGAHAGSLPSILSAFATTRPGRLMFQLAGAGVVLLLAMAPRTLPPRSAPLPDRRSPLEHVDALARAYQQVGATRTAAQRLVRGLRRRMRSEVVGASGGQSDAQFLEHVLQHHPTLREDVAVLRTAMENDIDRRQWLVVPAAISRIERTLTRT